MNYSQFFDTPCKLVGGIFWTITYLLIIRKGFTDKSYGMPFVALAFNISWEIIFSFLYPPSQPQRTINIIWFLFDCIIVYQFLRFGKSRNEYSIPSQWLYPVAGSIFLLSFLHTLTMTLEFDDGIGKYSAFTMNLTMSVLYVVLYFRRRSLIGQSIWIAVFKMLGTASFSLLFFLRFPTAPFMNFLYVSILVFDVYYVVLVARHSGTAVHGERIFE